MKHYEKFNRLQEKLIELSASNEIITATYHELGQLSGISNASSVRNYLTKMVSDNFLIVVNEPKRGVRGTSYKVNKSMATKATADDESEFITIEFEGVNLSILKYTEIGMCLSVEDLSISTLSDLSTCEKIFESNRELFEHNLIQINGSVFINRIGILLFLAKLNLDKVLETKKNTLIHFNQVIISIMSESIAMGVVVMKDHEHIEIKTNIGRLVDLDKGQIETLFHKIEEDVNKIFDKCKGELVSSKRELIQVEKKLSREHSLFESEKHKKELCMTEVQGLKGKLMERSSN